MTIRIVLADDHDLVRSGIRSLIEHMPDVVVVGEASNGRDALAQAETHQPDLVVLDITMPGLNGIDVAEQIKRQDTNVGVLLLSMHSSDDTIRRALAAGADGYLLKDAGPHELAAAIRAVAAGEGYLSPPIAKRLMEGRVNPDGPGVLTARQREVLQLVAEGCSTKAVAKQLGISPKTVENHRAQVMERLGLPGIPALVKYAIQEGLISSD